MFRTSGIINRNDDQIYFGYTASFTATDIYTSQSKLKISLL